MILDICILLLLLIGVWRGFRKGFVIELFTFFALFLGLYAGIHFSDHLVHWFYPDGVSEASYFPVIAFLLCFLAVGAMVYFGGKAFEKVVKLAQLSLLNRLLGAFFGLVKTLFVLAALLMVFDSYNERNHLVDEDTIQKSKLYKGCIEVLTFCIPAFDSSTLYLREVLEKPEVGQLKSIEHTNP